MFRRSVILPLLALFVTAAVFLIVAESWSTSAPKRVVLVTIDTLRADHLKSYGYFRETSPFLDRLAATGVRFSRAFSASSHTAPSHASIFTSRFPFQHGLRANGERLNEDLFHMRDLFESAGYKIGAFPAVRFMNGFVGFDEIEAPPGQYRKRAPLIRGDKNINRVLEWLKGVGDDEPFFLWVHLYDVHQWQLTRQIPPKELALMRKTTPPNLREKLHERRALPADFFKDDQRLADAYNGYDAQLLFVDRQLERLSEALEERGLDDDLLWVVTADHGEGLGNHYYSGHGEHLYQEQLHVPLILNHPSLEPRVVDELVRSVDILPSLAELFAFDLQAQAPHTEGVSLVPLMRGTSSQRDAARLVFAERRPKDEVTFRRRWREGDVFAVHNGEHKYIHYTEGPSELYDLRSDPFELSNIIDSDEQGIRELGSELASVLSRVEGSGATDRSGMSEEILKDLKTLGYL